MRKVLGYIAGVIVLLALGAGVAWYGHGMRRHKAEVQREDEQSTAGVHAPSVASRTAEDAMQATSVTARVIDDQTRAFADAVGSATAVLDSNLTNVTEEFIAQVFKGLSDPTDILDVIKPYVYGGTFEKRGIARAFYRYMLQHYPEERLQACAHAWLGRLYSRDALYAGTFDPEAFSRSVAHFEAVINLPSKQYWYYASLDDLAGAYMVAGYKLGHYTPDGYLRRAYDMYNRLHEEAKEVWMKEYAVCEMARCMAALTDEECRAFYERYRHTFTSGKRREEFENEAQKYLMKDSTL